MASNKYVDIKMTFIKNIIDLAIELFTYICNLSFIKGVFPRRY